MFNTPCITADTETLFRQSAHDVSTSITALMIRSPSRQLQFSRSFHMPPTVVAMLDGHFAAAFRTKDELSRQRTEGEKRREQEVPLWPRRGTVPV